MIVLFVLILLGDFKWDMHYAAPAFRVINLCRFRITPLREFLISEPLASLVLNCAPVNSWGDFSE